MSKAHHERRILIAWGFQDFRAFEKLVNEIVRKSEVNKEGDLVRADRIIGKEDMPPDLLS